MQTPGPIAHQARNQFSDDYVNMGPARTLQAGLTTPSYTRVEPSENCGRFSGSTDPWYQYVEFVGHSKGYINCVAKSSQGKLHTYESKIVKYSDGAYYAEAFIDGNAQVIERLHNRRYFRLGREGTEGAQVSAEASNANREMTGYFFDVAIRPDIFAGSFVTPDLYSPFHDPGFVRYGGIANFCGADAGTASSKGCKKGFG